MKKFTLFLILMVGFILTSTAQEKFTVDSNIPIKEFSYWGGVYSVTDTNTVTFIKKYTFGWLGPNPIEIPSTVTYKDKTYRVTAISQDALNEIVSWAENITIPSTITFIPKPTTLWGGSLGLDIYIIVDKDNPIYDSRDNCNAIIHTASNTLIAGCKETRIPKSITAIGDFAFAGRGLTNIDIPNSVTSIGDFAFCNGYYDSISHIVSIPKSVTAIGKGAFIRCCDFTVATDNPVYDSRDNCNAIIHTASNTLIAGCKETRIPKSITTIGSHAFYWSDITAIDIPNSVTSIGDSAFYGSNISAINIPNSVTSIGDYAFAHCYQLWKIELPNSIVSLGDNCFLGCPITHLTIPKSVTSIGRRGVGSGRLESITVNKNNPVYDSRDNCNAIIHTATNTLIAGCENTYIPKSITAIGDFAFVGKGITAIDIPNSVTSIGDSAFYDSDITTIDIPNSVTSIGKGAFADCNLTEFNIPNSVTYIGDGAFDNIINLNLDTYFLDHDVPNIHLDRNHPVYALQYDDDGEVIRIVEKKTGRVVSTIDIFE